MVKRYQNAFSLIEVLVAWAILLIGLLGVMRFELFGMQRVYQAYLRSVAVTQVANLFERFRACSTQPEKVQQKKIWMQRTQDLLSNMQVTVNFSGYQIDVNLKWYAKGWQQLHMVSF